MTTITINEKLKLSKTNFKDLGEMIQYFNKLGKEKKKKNKILDYLESEEYKNENNKVYSDVDLFINDLRKGI